MCTCMGYCRVESMARTIAVSDEVYDLLKKAQMPGESFSAVIKRSLKRSTKFSEIIGSRTLSRRDWALARRELGLLPLSGKTAKIMWENKNDVIWDEVGRW